MADHFHSIINDENDVSISKDSTKPEPSNSKRRKKKALSAINQNVVMNNLGNEKTYNWRPQAIRSDEVYADRELDSKISDSESSLPKQSKGNSTRNRTSTSVHSVNHEQQEKTNSRGQNDSLKDKEARRLRVVLTEKDRQLASLHHMLQMSQAAVQDLQLTTEKYKRNEIEAKKNLSSKESYCRRQSAISNMQMKNIHSTLQKLYSREERLQIAAEKRVMRSQLDRKDLEDELEKVEVEFEQRLVEQSEAHRVELESLNSKFQDEMESVKTKCNNTMAEQVLHQTESYNETLHHFEHALALLEGQAVKAANTNSNLIEELTALRGENASLSAHISTQQRDIEDLHNELLQKTAENKTLSLELVNVRNDFESHKQNSSESAAVIHTTLTAEIEQLKSTNNKYAVQLKRNATELSRRISQYATMQARLDDTMHKLSFLEQQGADKEQEFGFEVETKQHIFRSIKEENRSLSESLSLASDEIKRLRDEEYLHTCVISDMTREMHLLVGQRCEAQNSCQELQQNMQQLQYELEEKITSLQNAEDKNQEFMSELQCQQKVVENCHQAVQQAKSEVSEYLSQMKVMERKAADAEHEKKQLFELLGTTQTQLSDKQLELRESHTALVSMRDERNTLRAMQQESLRHTDSLFDALTAEEQLAAALQAELEQKTQSVNLLLKEVDEMEAVTKQLKTLQSQLRSCEDNLLEKSTAVELLSMRLNEAEQTHILSLQRLKESLEGDLQALSDDNCSLKLQLEEVSGAFALKVNQLNALNTAAANEIGMLVNQKEALSTQLNRMESELAANNSAYSDQISAVEQENEELLDKLHIMRGEHSQLQSAVDSLTSEAESLQGRLRDMFDELASAQQRHADDSGRLLCVVDRHAAEKEELVLQLEALHAKMNERELEINALEEEKNRFMTLCKDEVAISKEKDQQRIDALEEALVSIKAENKFLGSENAKLSGHHNSKQKIHYIETLKLQLQNLMDENAKLKDNVTIK